MARYSLRPSYYTGYSDPCSFSDSLSLSYFPLDFSRSELGRALDLLAELDSSDCDPMLASPAIWKEGDLSNDLAGSRHLRPLRHRLSAWASYLARWILQDSIDSNLKTKVSQQAKEEIQKTLRLAGQYGAMHAVIDNVASIVPNGRLALSIIRIAPNDVELQAIHGHWYSPKVSDKERKR